MSEPLIVLAAGQGSRLRPLTDEIPKCMVALHGRALLEWQLDVAAEVGVTDTLVVAGYRRERITPRARSVVVNPRFESTNMVESLWCAAPSFGDGFLVGYGDIVYAPAALRALRATGEGVHVVVDRAWRSYWEQRSEDVLADAESLRVDARGALVSIGQKETRVEDIQGQYIGLLAFRGSGVASAHALVAREREAHARGERRMCAKRSMPQLYMTDLLQGLIDAGVEVRPVWIDGGWLEVDTVADLRLAERLTSVREGRLVFHR